MFNLVCFRLLLTPVVNHGLMLLIFLVLDALSTYYTCIPCFRRPVYLLHPYSLFQTPCLHVIFIFLVSEALPTYYIRNICFRRPVNLLHPYSLIQTPCLPVTPVFLILVALSTCYTCCLLPCSRRPVYLLNLYSLFQTPCLPVTPVVYRRQRTHPVVGAQPSPRR